MRKKSLREFLNNQAHCREPLGGSGINRELRCPVQYDQNHCL
jgi:hypothetical protein